jgi:hypothetical protein
MFWLTEDAGLVCSHESGSVDIIATQTLVFVDGRRVLVKPDPVGRPINVCPWVAPGQKPCTTTLPVQQGYSSNISIDGRAVCLDTVVGQTDGTPPGSFQYFVRRPGQGLVEQLA